MVAFPELAITGYPPEDLLLKPRFVADNRRALQEIVRHRRGLAAVVGYVSQSDGHRSETGSPAGSARRRARTLQCSGGHRRSEAHHDLLQVVLAELWACLTRAAIFIQAGGCRSSVCAVTVVGVNICEDVWLPEGPTGFQAAAGAEIIVNINASPFHLGKSRVREQMLATRARENGVVLTYTNAVGGQDELVFDGNSVILDHQGEVIARGKAFEEDLIVADLNMEAVARARRTGGRSSCRGGLPPLWRSVLRRFHLFKKLGARGPRRGGGPGPAGGSVSGSHVGGARLREENGFTRAVIGLSGGVDSALTAVLAVDALGAENVWGCSCRRPIRRKTVTTMSPNWGNGFRDLRPDDSHHDDV